MIENTRRTTGQPRGISSAIWMLLTGCFLVFALLNPAAAQAPQHPVQNLKITILSTNVAGAPNHTIAEWGFSALVEEDGHRFLVDTGSHPDTVLKNAEAMHIDLSNVQEVILTHHHWDHVSGLLTLRRELMKQNPKALSIVHVSQGIFYSRPTPKGENNPMIAIRKEYEATGGRFIVHATDAELFPGVWYTGPVPRIYPEHNWSGSGKVLTPHGLVEDNIPEDSSIVFDTPKGLVILTGCGHAGIVNITTFTEKHFSNQPVYGIVGGLHLFAQTDQTVDWTASKLKGFHVENLLGAHCTGMEATYRLRRELGLDRKTAVVATVGSSFSLANGVQTGPLAR